MTLYADPREPELSTNNANNHEYDPGHPIEPRSCLYALLSAISSIRDYSRRLVDSPFHPRITLIITNGLGQPIDPHLSPVLLAIRHFQYSRLFVKIRG